MGHSRRFYYNIIRIKTGLMKGRPNEETKKNLIKRKTKKQARKILGLKVGKKNDN